MAEKTSNSHAAALPYSPHVSDRPPLPTFRITRLGAAATSLAPVQPVDPADPVDPVPAQKLPPGTYLQYVGFDQAGGIREYRFRHISRGEQSRELVVTTDMSLFVKYRVAIQEGPALCLHILLEWWDTFGASTACTSRSLTDSDIVAHVARRPKPRPKVQ